MEAIVLLMYDAPFIRGDVSIAMNMWLDVQLPWHWRKCKREDMEMRAAITTVPRLGIGYGYCEQTLRELVQKDASFRESDLGVFVDHRVLPRVPTGAFVHVTPEHELEEAWHGGVRLTLNLARALDWISESGEPGCVFEDDVILATAWHARTEAIVRRANEVSADWMITLHHLYKVEDFDRVSETGVGNDVLMRWRHPLAFYCNHGLCLTAAVARNFATTIREKMKLPVAEALGWYADIGVNKMCAMYKVPIFSSHPCLCKHVGEVSAYGHKAPPATLYFEG